jgi:hypothetical protein
VNTPKVLSYSEEVTVVLTRVDEARNVLLVFLDREWGILPDGFREQLIQMGEAGELTPFEQVPLLSAGFRVEFGSPSTYKEFGGPQ